MAVILVEVNIPPIFEKQFSSEIDEIQAFLEGFLKGNESFLWKTSMIVPYLKVRGQIGTYITGFDYNSPICTEPSESSGRVALDRFHFSKTYFYTCIASVISSILSQKARNYSQQQTLI